MIVNTVLESKKLIKYEKEKTFHNTLHRGRQLKMVLDCARVVATATKAPR